MQIRRHSFTCCLLRICLANICLPIFLNSWGFISKKIKTHSRYNASLCHIPARLFICVQLHLDFLLCYLLYIESSFSFYLQLCGRRKIVLLNTDPNWLSNKPIKEMVHFSLQNLPQEPLQLITKPLSENERKKR